MNTRSIKNKNNFPTKKKLELILRTTLLPESLSSQEISDIMIAGDPCKIYGRNPFYIISKAFDGYLLLREFYGKDSKESNAALDKYHSISEMYKQNMG